jgi:hypothetical protein
MRFVAIRAANACRIHFAAEERGEFVVLLSHLAVRIKQVRPLRDREREMVEELVARREVAGQFTAARVAGTTHVQHLVTALANSSDANTDIRRSRPRP